MASVTADGAHLRARAGGEPDGGAERLVRAGRSDVAHADRAQALVRPPRVATRRAGGRTRGVAEQTLTDAARDEPAGRPPVRGPDNDRERLLLLGVHRDDDQPSV